MAVLQRQREHEEVSIVGVAVAQQQSTQGDRYDEQVDRHHVGGKLPHGAAYMVLITILNHHDVKLSRQEHYGHH